MYHYIGYPITKSSIHLQIEAGICAVPTDDAVAIGIVNSYTFIVRLRSLPRFAETIRGRVAQRNAPWLPRVVCVCVGGGGGCLRIRIRFLVAKRRANYGIAHNYSVV